MVLDFRKESLDQNETQPSRNMNERVLKTIKLLINNRNSGEQHPATGSDSSSVSQIECISTGPVLFDTETPNFSLAFNGHNPTPPVPKPVKLDMKKNQSLDSISSQRAILYDDIVNSADAKSETSNQDRAAHTARHLKTRLLYLLLFVTLLLFVLIVALFVFFYTTHDGKCLLGLTNCHADHNLKNVSLVEPKPPSQSLNLTHFIDLSTTSTIEPTTKLKAVTTTNPSTSSSSTTDPTRVECKHGFSGVNCSDECGLTFFKPNARIVGGKLAVPHSWPSLAFILFNYKANVRLPYFNILYQLSRSYMCSGLLIDRKTIVTAAHCIVRKIDFIYKNIQFSTEVVPNAFYPTTESMYRVYIGLDDKTIINSAYEISPARQTPIDRIIKHEKYNEKVKTDDIALIKLKEEVTLNEFVQLACLPDPSVDVYPSKTSISAITMGWGTLSSGGPTSGQLQNVRLNIYDGNKCDSVVKNYPKNWTAQICAGDYNGGKDSCQGDSGGGLFVEDFIDNKAKYIAAGLVSYGEGCAEKSKPGVYTRLSHYTKWIRERL